MSKYRERLLKEAEEMAKIITNQMDTVDAYGGWDKLPESTKLQAIDRMKQLAANKLEGMAEAYKKADYEGLLYAQKHLQWIESGVGSAPIQEDMRIRLISEGLIES